VDVCLTQKGADLIDEILPYHIANEQDVLQSLSAREREHRDRLIDKLVDRVEA
jgi:DNA-binding MarR family transcriptional regulator